MSIQKVLITRFAFALCAGLLALQTHAANPTSEQLQLMPGPMRAEVVKRLIAQQSTRSSTSSSPRGVDVTPPVLTAFDADATLNADDINAQILFRFNVSDDFSGVDFLYVHVSSPSGHQHSWTGMTLHGQRQFNGRVAMGARPYAEVGTWSVQEVIGADLARNFFYCESACLARLGNIQFAVTASISDTQAPTLVSGKLLKTRVSLSKPARGTEEAMPHIAAQMSFTDFGQSGLGEVGANFCRLSDALDCLYVGGPGYSRDLGNNPSVIVGSSLYLASPGVYELKSLGALDRAGNFSEYTSTKFGGETDFSRFFPSTTITLVP